MADATKGVTLHPGDAVQFTPGEDVNTKYVHHITPALDPNWDDLTKLRWNADRVYADCGIRVDIHPQDRRDEYTLSLPGCAIGPFNFYHAWTFMHGVSSGAQAARRTNHTRKP